MSSQAEAISVETIQARVPIILETLAIAEARADVAPIDLNQIPSLTDSKESVRQIKSEVMGYLQIRPSEIGMDNVLARQLLNIYRQAQVISRKVGIKIQRINITHSFDQVQGPSVQNESQSQPDQ